MTTPADGSKVSTSCVSQAAATAAGCFSGSDSVSLEGGETKLISEVIVGDRVLTADRKGALSYADVVFIPHAANTETASFVELITEKGQTVKMTEKHLVKTCGGDLAYAGSLKPMIACVQTVEGDAMVTSVRRVQSKGLYTVVTTSEFVVVSGIVASPFSFSHSIVHGYYNIHRALYKISPALTKGSVVSMTNAIVGTVAVFAVDSVTAGI